MIIHNSLRCGPSRATSLNRHSSRWEWRHQEAAAAAKKRLRQAGWRSKAARSKTGSTFGPPPHTHTQTHKHAHTHPSTHTHVAFAPVLSSFPPTLPPLHTHTPLLLIIISPRPTGVPQRTRRAGAQPTATPSLRTGRLTTTVASRIGQPTGPPASWLRERSVRRVQRRRKSSTTATSGSASRRPSQSTRPRVSRSRA